MSTKLKEFLTDNFILLGAIVGMGFATGKEIKVFFLNGDLYLFSLVVFCVFFLVCFDIVVGYKSKYGISDFKSFNKSLFKKAYKCVDPILIVVYVVASSAMLAGLDELTKIIFGNRIPLSIGLSVITFFCVIGGIDRIKKISLKLMPVLLVLIFLNLFVNAYNITFHFSSYKMIFGFSRFNLKSIGSFIMPLVFLGGNFILAISGILKMKSKPRGIKITSTIILFVLLFLGIIVASNTEGLMPFLNTSKNLSNVFFVFYLIAILVALISSLMISTFSSFELFKKKTHFNLLVLTMLNQTIAFLGLEFIVKYLYAFSGLLGLIYLIIINIKIIKNTK